MAKKRRSGERPEFWASNVVLLNCMPGNYDGAKGEPAVIVTVGTRSGDVSPLVLNLDDSQKLVAKLLVALATNDDKFAQFLLDKHFAADAKGHFKWPDRPYGSLF